RIELWPHQRAAVDAAHEALAGGHSAGLWVMPTGSGKTLAFCTLARELGRPTLVVVHRDELVRQATRALKMAWPRARVVALGDEGSEIADVLVATVQSLSNRLDRFGAGEFGLVVVDEAHHAPAGSWRKVIGHFRPELLLGCTATPERHDGEPLLPLF